MNARRAVIFLAAAVALAAMAPAAASAAAPAPAWRIALTSMPSNFSPGAHGTPSTGPRYNIRVINLGGAPATGPIVITDTLPAGLTPGTLEPLSNCSAAGQVVTCEYASTIYPAGGIEFSFGVDAGTLPDPTVLEADEATVSSPGAPPATATTTTTVSSEEGPFGFDAGNAGLGAWLTEADGSPTTTAGSHPWQLTFNVGFETKKGNEQGTTILTSGGGARDAHTALPPGLIIDPAATPVRCTEEQYVVGECPEAADIGRSHVTLSFAGIAAFSNDPVFNMVPPPGVPAEFAFDPGTTGLHVHVLGGVRAGDYALTGDVNAIPALFNHPVYATQLQFWGDPSSPAFDHTRGNCLEEIGGTCTVPKQDVAAVTLPTSCTSSLLFRAEIDSWDEPDHFLSASTPFTDLEGNPTATSGCNAVPFKPALSVQPTTNLADSPSGLDVDLHIPQTESLASTATAHLKTATVTLPEGLVVNPSSANGLAGCAPDQVGIDPSTGVADGHPVTCPDASKIGSVEVDSPLLAEYDSENKVERNSEGKVIPEPIDGAVYLASPHDNPFRSLLAIYLVFSDPAHGILVKLAGQVVADPETGRLTTTFSGNPQLPFEDFKLHFFGGAGAALKTPLSCGTKTTSSNFTPWSAPEGADVAVSDSFQTTAEPGGGACPHSDSGAINAPAFNAGTIAPQAGAYSPLVLHLAREDGTAPISAIDTTLPEGLTGKLAGISYCPDAALTAAEAKSGSQEKSSPSCPASSEVGSVDVGAGAGPTPYYTTGKVYLAGPYKGAPLSLAIITPATAGPYDLGTVVVRTALYVDPETARIHAVSDRIPQILDGIPLDVRSISLRMSRPDFTLNPTSCDPMTLSGIATSPFGTTAALSNPFQVGACSGLKFKPKLSLKLSGGVKRSANPALRATLIMPEGGSNIASASVALPHSEFLDQAHIKTICTRVQFNAGGGHGEQCPAGSVYGHARAFTPLLDAPLEGPVYLRSSSHALPDLVAALNGQIDIDLDGRIDSVHGGIRNSFEAVPDAPVSKFILSMQGGKKGLLENSRNLCRTVNRATLKFTAQNGLVSDYNPAVKNSCKSKRHVNHRAHGRSQRAAG